MFLHDAIYLIANATHQVVSGGQWELTKTVTSNQLFPNRSVNAGKVREAITQVCVLLVYMFVYAKI